MPWASVERAQDPPGTPANAEPSKSLVKLRTVQCNVKSSTQRDTYGTLGAKRRLRSDLVRCQLQPLEAHLVGLQETRNPKGERPRDFFCG
eukprot:2661553-Pyramimonas_sp.AAC.1